ncbi:hypothetical protein APHAL10511_007336 [Amanita phalloides]|nr:hypothetical protein APHAL10511_007336 [Amanita phalloides]
MEISSLHLSLNLPFVETIRSITSQLPVKLKRPRVGIVCGSGLSGLVESLRETVLMPYETLPGFAKSTVSGHKSALAFGLMGEEGIPVIAMLGRFHFYEGHNFHAIMYPIRIMARLGVKNIIITNAAGSVNPKIPVGTIVVVQDHLGFPNLTGNNPLIGAQVSHSFPRFLPLSDAYSPALRRYAFLAASELCLDDDALAEGTYAWVSGPTYETPAEGRFLRSVGADVVGMSTIPEVVAAREEGMNVLVLSLVTNFVVIPEKHRSIKEEVAAELAGKRVELPELQVVSHEEVILKGKEKADMMKKLVSRIVQLSELQQANLAISSLLVLQRSAPAITDLLHGPPFAMANTNGALMSPLPMEDELGIVYLIETPQHFWSELEDSLQLPTDNSATLSLLDSALRRFLSLCATYHEQYLQTPLQLDHACTLLLDSELFQFHSERMCDIIAKDAQVITDPHSQFIFYQVLLSYGQRRTPFLRNHKRWQPLLPLLMDHVLVDIDPDLEDTYFGTAGGSSSGAVVPVPIEAKLRSLSVRLLYEVCRVQKLSVTDLRVFYDNFIDYLFDLIEQTRHMQDETFNYSVIKLIAALNEQFMVASLSPNDAQQEKESKNRVLRVLMRRLNLSKTFGENMIFMLNRAKHTPEDFCMQHLILKVLYILFTTAGASEYFYTNDLRVLVDVFLRELVDLDEENESLRHTYLRVLYPLLAKTQLRNIPYKRSQLVYALESLLGNSRIRDVNPTTRRLVERCLNGDWCAQFRKPREVDPGRASPISDSSSAFSPTVGEAVSTAAAVYLERTPSAKIKTLKLSRSVENLTGRLNPRTPLDDIRRAGNGSVISLHASVAGPPGPPLRGSKLKNNGSSEGLGYSDRYERSDPATTARKSPNQPSSFLSAPPSGRNLTSSVLSEGAMGKVKTRRPPPPAPPKRRKPPAVPSHGGSNGVIMTTIRSSSSSLSKTAIELRTSVS